MEYRAKIMDSAQFQRSLARMTHEIIEKNHGAEQLCLLGIKRRGIPLAELLGDNLKRFAGVEVPVGSVDITRYRDDLSAPVLPQSETDCRIPCDLTGCTVILVDDVLYTGRTVRAAIHAIMLHGRPRAIRLAVLIDRGHRELPIRPDYVGKSIPTARDEVVRVMVEAYDGENGVALYKK